jgi:predicted HicB family RNase H-like nuclease
MENKITIFYIAIAEVAGNKGIGVVMDDGICNIETGMKFSGTKKEMLKKAVEEFMRVYKAFCSGKNVEIYTSPSDFEMVLKLLPERLKGFLDRCSYNPAVQVAAEYAGVSIELCKFYHTSNLSPKISESWP